MLYALGRGLGDAEIADALALPGQLGRILVKLKLKLKLRDRAAAIVHAFDCALVVPGHGPRREAAARGAVFIGGRPRTRTMASGLRARPVESIARRAARGRRTAPAAGRAGGTGADPGSFGQPAGTPERCLGDGVAGRARLGRRRATCRAPLTASDEDRGAYRLLHTGGRQGTTAGARLDFYDHGMTTVIEGRIHVVRFDTTVPVQESVEGRT
ncbi:hypothetical protein ACFZCP_16100 [Streptomyces sp. NPDC007971]|uniref:hypothetical protein n=1 Tax=Streptomyces sp. NPDC007971 TaxID=3364799 RepID=UPI0036E83E02